MPLLFLCFPVGEIFKRHVKDCFKINGRQTPKMSKEGEYFKFKDFKRKIKLSFMIYADIENILVPEDNVKQNPKESYTNKYQKHVSCSYVYKLVCVNDKFSKPSKSYFGKNAVYNFIGSMIVESKYCSDVMKKHFNKELVMTKEDNDDFENSTKCWICDNNYINNDVKVKDHFHVTEKYKGSAHRYCNINVKLNHKIPIVFHRLKNCDSHLIMQELGKFNVISKRSEKYLSFSINNKLSFIDSFQFLSSSLDSLVKNLAKDEFNYLS